ALAMPADRLARAIRARRAEEHARLDHDLSRPKQAAEVVAQVPGDGGADAALVDKVLRGGHAAMKRRLLLLAVLLLVEREGRLDRRPRRREGAAVGQRAKVEIHRLFVHSASR